MTAPELDERVHWDAIADALAAEVGTGRVFKYGDVPGLDGNAGDIPPIFVLLTVQRRYTSTGRLSARHSRSGWRVSTRYVGRTVDEAAWAALRATRALDDMRLSIGTRTSTPIHHESTQSIKPDGARLSGSSSWTYAL